MMLTNGVAAGTMPMPAGMTRRKMSLSRLSLHLTSALLVHTTGTVTARQQITGEMTSLVLLPVLLR